MSGSVPLRFADGIPPLTGTQRSPVTQRGITRPGQRQVSRELEILVDANLLSAEPERGLAQGALDPRTE